MPALGHRCVPGHWQCMGMIVVIVEHQRKCPKSAGHMNCRKYLNTIANIVYLNTMANGEGL